MSDRTGLDVSDEAVLDDREWFVSGKFVCAGEESLILCRSEEQASEIVRDHNLLVAEVRELRTRVQVLDECCNAEAVRGNEAEAEVRTLRAENRTLIKDRAANEKANIASRRSICEQSDRFKSERDSLAARLAEVEAERDAARETIERLSHWPRQTAALAVAEAQLAAVRELHRPGTMTDELYFPDCWRCPNPADCEGHEVTCCTACYGRDEYGESAPNPWPCPTAALAAVPGLLETHSKPDLSSSETDRVAEIGQVCANISRVITASYPEGMDPELVMRRRTGKVGVENAPVPQHGRAANWPKWNAGKKTYTRACLCGWLSPERWSEQKADADIDAHLASPVTQQEER